MHHHSPAKVRPRWGEACAQPQPSKGKTKTLLERNGILLELNGTFSELNGTLLELNQTLLEPNWILLELNGTEL